MKTLSLRKQAQQAPKFVLKLEDLNLFLASTQNLTGCKLTQDIKHAQQFSVGFDNPETKTSIWNATAQRQMNNKNVNFTVVNL